MLAVNKVDGVKEEEDYRVFLELAGTRSSRVWRSPSAKGGISTISILRIYDLAGIIRVYTKAPGQEPDLSAPFVLPRESTLEDLAVKIHKDFQEKLKYARIWGKAVFSGQMVQKDYVLQDGDVAEFHL